MESKDYYPDYSKLIAGEVEPEEEEPPKPAEPRKPGVAIAAMILGACSFTIWVCCIAVWIATGTAWILPFIASFPCAIMGFAAWRLSRREEPLLDHKYQGYVKAGRIVGKVGFFFSTLFAIFMIFTIITFLSIGRG